MQRVDTPSTPLAFYESGAGDQTLLLGHALGSDHRMWQQVVDLLPDDIRVILWEQPGHGESGLLQEDAPDAASVADAVAAGLADLGVSETVAAGLSLGGIVTLALAAAHPSLAPRAVMLDSAPVLLPSSMWSDRADQVEKDGVEAQVGPAMERWFTPEFAEGVGAAAVTEIENIFLGTNPQGYAQGCRIIANTNLTEQLQTLAAELLVVVGREDAGTPPEVAMEMTIQAPNGRGPIIIDGARHLPAVEQPQQVASLLAAFVGD